MQDLLVHLNRVRGVGGSLLVSAEGLTMAAQLRTGVDESALAANIGELLGAAQRTAQHLGLGAPTSFNAVTDQGGVLLLATGPAYIALLVDAGANLALLAIESRPHIERIAGRLAL
jgi:predicted regulator of Ras-like GTPase activity (Roadblock/LC7/MglB family)